MDTWSIGDVPVGTIEIAPSIATTGYLAAEAALVAPDGTATVLVASIVEDATDAGIVVVTWPEGFAFAVAGVHRIRVTLTGPGAARRRIADEPIIVEDHDSGWHTLMSAEAAWPEAARLNDLVLWELLESARVDCLAYATNGTRTAPTPVPAPWRRAQLMQVIERYQSGLQSDSGDELAGQGFTIPWRPMERKVKQLLRPTTRDPRSIR